MKRHRYTIAVLATGMLMSATPADATVNTHPTTRDAKRWVRVWCKAQPGWSRTHVIQVMGKPTLRLPDQSQWDAYGYHFTMFLDENGKARQLYFNQSMLSSAQRRRLKCDAVRT